MKTQNEFPVEIAARRAIDRRGFLRLAALTAGAVAGTERLAPSLLRPPAAAAPASLRLAPCDVPAPGEARAVRLDDGRSALVVRVDAASLVAFDRRCPHLGCPVLWSPDRRRLECPCHDAAFDARTGRVLHGPPRRGLDRIAVELPEKSRCA